MPGPLPDPHRKRRNAPTIPTTDLPQSGLAALGIAAPKCQAELGPKGEAWWAWAWETPQAVGWGVGAGIESLVARRAQLEDDLASCEAKERQGMLRQMLDMDDRLGLTPKGLAALRWRIVADPEPTEAAGESSDEVAAVRQRRARIAAS